jgi:hypothetical protein
VGGRFESGRGAGKQSCVSAFTDERSNNMEKGSSAPRGPPAAEELLKSFSFRLIQGSWARNLFRRPSPESMCNPARGGPAERARAQGAEIPPQSWEM